MKKILLGIVFICLISGCTNIAGKKASIELCEKDPATGECKKTLCSTSADCGSEMFTGHYYCKDGDVYRNKIFFSCLNPGTVNALCSQDVRQMLMDDCIQNEYCYDGAAECRAYGNQLCRFDSDCGKNGFDGPQSCENNQLYQRYIQYKCNAANTSGAFCSNTSTMMLLGEGCGNELQSLGCAVVIDEINVYPLKAKQGDEVDVEAKITNTCKDALAYSKTASVIGPSGSIELSPKTEFTINPGESLTIDVLKQIFTNPGVHTLTLTVKSTRDVTKQTDLNIYAVQKVCVKKFLFFCQQYETKIVY